jgi:hypothetical protein
MVVGCLYTKRQNVCNEERYYETEYFYKKKKKKKKANYIMNYDFTIINNSLNSSKNEIYKLFNGFDYYLAEIKSKIKDYGIGEENNFNIFSSISDTYYKENLHSDIFKLILDPSTEKIGNPKNINLFVSLLNKIKPNLKINIGKNIVIEREKGRIDILIYDSKLNSIIIENKINFARDQDDQLGRYYNYVLKRGFKVKAIVYLTLSPEKQLDKNYSIKDFKLREAIKDLIIPLSVLNKKNEKNIIEDFIDQCIKYSENNIIARVYYSEYKELLKSLGGNAMTNDLNSAALLEIYTNKEKLNQFNLFGSLWDKRVQIFNEIIRELLKENDFIEHPDDLKNTLYFKIDDNISLGYHIKDWSFGFTYTPKGKKQSKNLQDELKILLENKELKDIFCKEPTDSNEGWVWKTVDINKIGDCKSLISNFNVLRELVQK